MNTLRKNSGFTMVELIVTMAVFLLVIVAASNIFGTLLGQFKQQTGIAETGIEGIIGLELLRSDIEQAGFGLPWVLNGVNYTEAVAPDYNDAPSDPPRAFVHGDNVPGTPGVIPDGSDVLVIKATNVATNEAAQRYTYIANTGAGNNLQVWASDQDNLEKADAGNPNPNVIVINPVSGGSQRILISSGAFYTTYPPAAAFQPPPNSFSTYLIYGINTAGAPRMPFNRADYYIRVPAAAEIPSMPSRCATGTGILYKGVIKHSDGKHEELPIMDCVADFQVYFGLDQDNNGTTDIFGSPPANAADVRNQVREVHVFILAHEGQIDRAFTFNNFTPGACATCVRVGDSAVLGRDFDLAASGVTNWQNYRWKVYSMVIKPYNLR